MKKNTVAVVGAGMVGVSCALELQRRGYAVTLFDRTDPGRETSYGNAGVLARSSLMPFNNPGLWASLPRLLKNRSVQFRYSPRFLASNLSWALGFLYRARTRVFDETTEALNALIQLSGKEHQRLMADAGVAHRLRESGWIFLYRNEQGFAGGQLARDTFDRFGVSIEALDKHGLSDLEPHLKPVFERALWIKDAASVDSPGDIVQAYARLFVDRGGRIERRNISALRRIDGPGSNGSGGATSDGTSHATGSGVAASNSNGSSAHRETGSRWQAISDNGESHEAAHIVVALGPWSKVFMKQTLNVSVPMGFERGYHMHYEATQGATLTRPIYDTAGGYVLSPMAQGLRLTTGVELTAHDAPENLTQLGLAEQAARAAFPLGARAESTVWRGSRPTLPDSRPMIGECPGHAGIWLAFGHQHIGFSTGPGTAALLGSMMAGEPCAIQPAPFSPGRFIR